MSELRFDYARGDWVIVAPRRGQRPVPADWVAPNAPVGESGASAGGRRGERGNVSEGQGAPPCPFCPGQEDATPESIARVPETGPWRVRVIPNRFPAVGDADGEGPMYALSPPTDDVGFSEQQEVLYRVAPGRGAHEVVVETPHHRRHWADFSVPELAEVLSVYRERYRVLSRREGVGYVALFRNDGAAGGASQVHPHGQLIALPVVPPAIARLWERAAAYRSAWGRCLYCTLVAAERFAARRWVLSTGGFAAFCPFAPRFSYETWIVPERHRASFADLADDELAALAGALRSLLGAMRTVLADPPFNVLLVNGGSGVGAGYHWHLQIVPRITPLAGFELGTGMAIVAVAPEEAARALRAAVQEENGVEVLKTDG